MNVRPFSLLCVALAALCIAPAARAETPELHLYGGEGIKEFLGCLNCSSYDPRSVCSEYGEHGSLFASFSIWNQYGIYGSVHSEQSPWSKHAWAVPLIRDGEGNFYGYFTANRTQEERTEIKSLLDLLNHPEEVEKSHREAKKRFCAEVKRHDPGREPPLRKLEKAKPEKEKGGFDF